MKNVASGLFTVGLAGLIVTLSAQGGQSKPDAVNYIGDRQGTSITGWEKARYENAGGGLRKFIVRPAAGGRIVGVWAKENLRADVGALDAVMSVGKEGAFELVSATMSSGIVADFTRPSSNPDAKSNQTVNVRAASAEYVSAKNEIEIRGGIHVERKDPGAGESLVATGSSGVLTLSAEGSKTNALKSAVLNGPVDLTLNGRRKGDDEKLQPYMMKGHADKVVFNDAARTIVFTGNVKLSGNDPGLGGEISGVHTATVTLTKSGEIDSIDLEGNPGKTVITDKKGGGGGR